MVSTSSSYDCHDIFTYSYIPDFNDFTTWLSRSCSSRDCSDYTLTQMSDYKDLTALLAVTSS